MAFSDIEVMMSAFAFAAEEVRSQALPVVHCVNDARYSLRRWDTSEQIKQTYFVVCGVFSEDRDFAQQFSEQVAALLPEKKQ